MQSREPIAIVGIGCRFPGNADSPAAFWKLLCEGRDAISEVPPDRWLVDAFYDPEPKPGRSPSRYGGFVHDLDQFDPHFFNISTREAAGMDPQQRLLLEVAWWALEDAGWPAEWIAGSLTGVFVGISTHDYADLQCAPTERKGSPNPYMCTGSALSIAANRISYVLDLRGPSLAVDTACSSSLVALHLACRSIWQGEAAQALVAGVNALLKPEMTFGFSQANMLSPTGRCHSFDQGADGYVRAEGAGCVALKPLLRALRDGDRVYAVVRGSAINQNGRTLGISLPSSAAQQSMLVQACADAGADPRDIQYVEAHGTGTAAGDPIESSAIATVMGRDRSAGAECVLGSVKSNIGHLEAGAGIAGLIKTALALYHRQIPGNLHFDTPNPKVDLTGLRVPRRLESWPVNACGTRLAGVNSFGFGGSNAHAVLAESPRAEESTAARDDDSGRASLLPVSARSDGALAALTSSFVELLRSPSAPTLVDLCYSAGARRTHHSHRLAVVANSTAVAADALEAYLRHDKTDRTALGRGATRTRIVFVFTGMGPQWLGMGRELLEQEPVFREAVVQCDRLFRMHSDISPLDELTAAEAHSRLNEDRVAQIALFSIQIGLVDLWRSWGIEADAIVGHSAGEMAAAWAAGALTLEDAVCVTFHRSRLQHRLHGKGRMLAVGLSREDAEVLVRGREGRIWLAAVNGTRSITLSGDAAALTEMTEILGRAGTFHRLLQGEIPYHSGLLDESRNELLGVLSRLKPRSTQRPLWSTVSGEIVQGTELSAAYWWQNIRQPVQFASVVNGLLDAGITGFVEVGPHPILASAIKECAAEIERDITLLPSLRRGECERATLLTTLGRLYALGHAVDWTALYPSGRLTSLPNYPWQRERHWRETESSRLLRLGLTDWNECGHLTPTVHPLLGRRLPTAHAQTAWQVELDLPRTHAWMADHVIQNTILYPAVGYFEMALEAGAEGRIAEDFEIHRPLALTRDNPQPIQLLVDRAQRIFTVHAQQPDGTWTRQASGRLGLPHHVTPAVEVDLASIRSRLRRELSGEELYKRYQQFGLQFGPLFRGIEQIWMGPGESLARIRVLPELAPHLSEYNFHPAVLDACLQVFLAATFDRASGLYLPVAVKRMQMHRALRELDAAAQRTLWSYARLTGRNSRQVTFDLTIYDDEGHPLIEIQNIVCKPAGAGGEVDLQLAEYAWRLQTRPGSEPVHTAGWRLPTADVLIETVRPVVESLAGLRDRSRYHRKFRDAQQHLTLGYVADAFRRLGWDFRRGECNTLETLADRLSVLAPFRPVLEQMLDVLAESGLMRRNGEMWEVVQVPEVQDPTDVWRRCMNRLPASLAEWTLMGAYGPLLAPILRGETSVSAVLSDGTAAWQHLFESSPSFRIYNEIVQQLVLGLVDRLPAERTIRVLGLAGSSGLATWLLPVLPLNRTTYVSSETGRGSTAPADDRFVAYPFVEHRSLNLGDDIGQQGFAPHSFDVVLGVRTLATSSDLRRDLENAQQLLAPGGLAMFVEPNGPFLSPVLSVVPGWSAAGDDSSIRRGIASAGFPMMFKNAGFASCDIVTDVGSNDSPPSHSVIVAQTPLNVARETSVELPDATGDWLVVAEGSSDDLAQRLASALVELGGQVVITRPGPQDARGVRAGTRSGQDWRGIVYLAAHDRSSGAELQMCAGAMSKGCMELVDLVRSTESASRSRLWIVTRCAQPVARADSLDLVDALLWGLGRVIGNELVHLRCSRIDLSAAPDGTEIWELARELASDGDDDEVGLRGPNRYVHVLEPRPEASVSAGSFALQNDTPGSLSGLVLRRAGRRTPGPGQVEIEVHATGLNFKDVAMAMKLLSDTGLPSEVPLGLDLGHECAGRVSAIGAEVDGVRVGDEVLAFALNSFASHVITDARFVLPRPAGLSAEEAASIPIVFLTAYHALHDLARLQADERVLIHSATGGVGLAAVQLAQRIGAEVYATAGSGEKRSLLQSLGVQHVFNSRSLDFASEIWERTGDTGIDVVLNSLGGDFIPRSLDLLRDGGRFVELGKRDLEQNMRLGLKPFNRQLSFFTIDLSRMAFTRPKVLERLQREVVALFERGELHVLPHRIFPVTRAREAFRSMLKAKHVGKLVVSMRAPGIAKLPDRECAPICDDGTYLITGGLGGFGLATARWLVEQGARHLVLIGRSGAARSEAQSEVETLRSTAVDVRVVQSDVADAEALAGTLSDIRNTMPTIKGVIHAAMVLDDCTISELTGPRLDRVLAPKARGAWNLHLLTRNDPIDLFILFSSVASTVGNPGQANYAAANAFLDVLAHHRRLLGLPALAINWGAVGDTGYLTRRDDVAQHLTRIGVRSAPVRQLLARLPELVVARATQVSVHSMDWRRLSKIIPSIAKGSRFAAVRGALRSDDTALTADDEMSVRERLLAMSVPDRRAWVQTVIQRELSRLLGTAPEEIDTGKPVIELGIDSLMAVELGVALSKTLQIEVPTMTLLGGSSIVQFAATLCPDNAATESAPPRS